MGDSDFMNNKLARKSYARIPDILELPRLIEVQLESFENFKKELALVTKCPGYGFSKNLAAAIGSGISRQEPLSNFVTALQKCGLNHCASVVCMQAN